ncbi:MAG: cellulase family glycosylhydrolase, partial [Saprospiraceae bacterium]
MGRRINQLPEQTTASIDDVLPIMDAPGGASITNKITLANLASSLSPLITTTISGGTGGINPAQTVLGYRGVSASGLEFNGSFQANSAAMYTYIAGKNFNVVRIPFEWYKMQPVLNSALDTTELAYLQQEVSWAKAAGLKVILDMHNYGRRYVYLDGGFVDDFASSTTRIFRYPYADHNTGAATLTVRDYGRAIAGTLTNARYSFTMTFRFDTNPNAFDELFIEGYRIDDNNRYYLAINPTLDTWFLRQVIGGTTTTLASGTKVFNLSTDYTIVFDINKTTNGKINTTIDGVALYTVNSVNSSSLTGGYIGVYGTAMHVTFKAVTLNVNGDTTSGGPVEYRVTDAALPMSSWNDFWTKLSTVFKTEDAVLGYDHNEPYTMPIPTSTLNYSQAAATANSVPLSTVTNMYQNMLTTIRANGDNKYIFVSWDSFDNLHRFTEFFGSNPTPWVIDSISPAKVAYTGHYYFDADHSGSYTNPAVPTTATVTSEVTPALIWAKNKGVPFLVGEVGWKNDTTWDAVATHFYNLCDQYGAWVTYWAAGNLYSSVTSIQPTATYTVDAQQMAIVQSHLGATSPVIINDLHNVVVTTPLDNQVLTYDSTTSNWVNQADSNGGMTLTVAASNASTKDIAKADYVCDGTADQVEIQAAIDALPANGGVVELSGGTYSTSGEIYWAKNSVTLKGQGMNATTIQATAANFNAIRIGNRQVDGFMRNDNRLQGFKVALAGGASSYGVIKFDGAGENTRVDDVKTGEGKYGFHLLDLDRCLFNNIYAGNVRTAAVYMEVGLENTYGTITFINPSMVLSDANSTCLLMGVNANQSSPNAIDRITIIGALYFSTAGLAGTKGIEVNVGLSSCIVLGSLFESPIQHIKLTGANSQLCQLTCIECTFLQNSGVSTDVVNFNTLNHIFTMQDCRVQKTTNVFNGASGFSIVNLLGRSNNQGSITNLFAGTFGAKQGTDTVFGGDATLAMGLNNNRFALTFTNKIIGNPLVLYPSSNGTAAVSFNKADGTTNIAKIDSTNSRLVIAEGANLQAGTTTGSKI